LFVAGFRRFPGKALSLQPLVIFPVVERGGRTLSGAFAIALF